MLAPHYMKFMTDAVIIIVSKALGPGISQIENNTLILIALYMATNKPAHNMMRDELRLHRREIIQEWENYFDMVILYNKKGMENARVNLPDILRRLRNENFGDSSSG